MMRKLARLYKKIKPYGWGSEKKYIYLEWNHYNTIEERTKMFAQLTYENKYCTDERFYLEIKYENDAWNVPMDMLYLT